MATANPLPSDVNGRRIQAGSVILSIDNISITTAGYTAITVPAGIFCKSILLKTRGSEDWRLALSSSPSEYITISSPLSIGIVAAAGDVIGYVRADTASDTLEILYLD